eukprot:382578_1
MATDWHNPYAHTASYFVFKSILTIISSFVSISILTIHWIEHNNHKFNDIPLNNLTTTRSRSISATPSTHTSKKPKKLKKYTLSQTIILRLTWSTIIIFCIICVIFALLTIVEQVARLNKVRVILCNPLTVRVLSSTFQFGVGLMHCLFMAQLYEIYNNTHFAYSPFTIRILSLIIMNLSIGASVIILLYLDVEPYHIGWLGQQHRTICQDLLLKTSETIKIKPPQTNKSQSSQPQPIQNEIDINDIYSHLKRQPWHYNNYNNESKPINKSNKSEITTSGSSGWNSYMSDVCNHNKKNNISNEIETEISEHKYQNENENESEIENEPGNIDIETPQNINDISDNEKDININNCNITLMGDNNEKIKFKNVSKCYEEIFNENVNNIMNEINECETIGNDNENNNNKLNQSIDNDNDNDSLIVSNITLMG